MSYIHLDDSSFIEPMPFTRAELVFFLKQLSRLLRVQLELTINCVDNPTSQQLNKTYRGRPTPTNVLSFPYEQGPQYSGELVIADAVLRDEAVALNLDIKQHYAHILVHGILHILGHDHEHDDEAHTMEELEKKCLLYLGYADPYKNHS